MITALRPYATAGVALVGAGVIAVSPVSAPVPDIAVASTPVTLSSTVDPITAWVNVFEAAGSNVTDLAGSWLDAPLPVLQQFVSNQLSYLGQLPDLPGIFEQILSHAEGAITAPFTADVASMSEQHEWLYTALVATATLPIIPFPVGPLLPPELRPLAGLAASPVTGLLLGLIGPILGPALAVGESIGSVIDALTASSPNLEAALFELINIPAAAVDAFLNGGQTLNVAPLVSLFGLDLGDDAEIGIALGGLLSPGGSLFNALTVNVDLGIPLVPAIDLPGEGPGFIGSLITLSQAVARGMGWNGSGNPLQEIEVFNAPETGLREAADPSVTSSVGFIIEEQTVPLANDDAAALGSRVSTEKPALQAESLKEVPEAELEKTATGEAAEEGASAGQEQDGKPVKPRHRFKRFNGPAKATPVSEAATETEATDNGSKKRWHKKKRSSQGSATGE